MASPGDAQALYQRADSLSRGKTGYADKPRDGYLPHASGRWRSPELHAQILDLFTQSYALAPLQGAALHRRALEHLNVGHVDAAQADQRQLAAMDSAYGRGVLPILVFLKKGERKVAQQHLDLLNVENKAKGLPKQTLADFEWL